MTSSAPLDDLAADPRVARIIAGTDTNALESRLPGRAVVEDEDAYYAARSILRS